MDKKILFVGAGSMAEAMISGIIKSDIVHSDNIYVTNKQNKEKLQYMSDTYGVQTSYDNEKMFAEADIVFLAMKPKDVQDSLMNIRPFIKEKQLYISVIAGVETKTMEHYLNKKVPVIRAMPNTSAAVGYSMTALASGTYTTEADMQLAEQLIQTIGVTKVVLEDEMDIVTAVSGSGPAYIYYFVEAMKKAANEAGMSQDIAEELITHTIIGAGKMLEQSGESPETLRKNITSEGGTTEAGIKALQSQDFEKAVALAVESAKNRSAELAETYRVQK